MARKNSNLISSRTVINASEQTPTISQGQTVLSGLSTIDVNRVDVFKNGIKLVPTEDFTVNSPTSITLTTALDDSDHISIMSIGSPSYVSGVDITGTTAAAPAPAVFNDADTGLFSAATNTLSISTAGTERVTIDASGNVGIGTSTPVATLDVAGEIVLDGVITAQGTTGSVDGRIAFSQDGDVRGWIGVPQWSGEGAMLIYGPDSDGPNASIEPFAKYVNSQLELRTNNINRIVIDSTGNVGIGTSTPSVPLQVDGNINATNSTNSVLISGDDGSIEIQRTGSPYIDFKTTAGEDHDVRLQQVDNGLTIATGGDGAATERMRITSDGKVGIGTDAPASPLEVYGQIRTSAAGTNYGSISGLSGAMYIGHRNGADDGALIFGGYGGGLFTEHMRLTPAGNLGIGTSSPVASLDVVSNAQYGNGLDIYDWGDSANGGGVGWSRINLRHSQSTSTEQGLIYVDQNMNFNVHHEDSGKDLIFKVKPAGGSTVSAIRIRSNGNIGIGHPTPDAILHVKDTTSGIDRGIRVDTGSVGANDDATLIFNNRANYGYVGNEIVISDRNANGTSTSKNFKISLADSDQFFIDYSTGFVGIGTATPAYKLDVSGNLRVAGNFIVDGTTTTINSTTLNVDDVNITVASGAVDAAAANGAGLTVDGANATLTYGNTNDNWTFNKKLNVNGSIQDDKGDVRQAPVTNNTAASYTIPSGSSGEMFRLGTGTTTVNVNNANFNEGDIVTLVNITGSDIALSFDAWSNGARIAGGDGTNLASTSTTNLAAYGVATLIAVANNRLVVNGNVS